MMNSVEGADAGAPAGAQATKAATQARLRALKKGVTAAAVVGFGVFSWLAIPRGTTPASSSSTVAPANGDAQQPTQTQNGSTGQNNQSQGGFFGQGDQSQGGFFGQGNQSQGGFFGQGGGYGFGNGQGGPVSGSGAS